MSTLLDVATVIRSDTDDAGQDWAAVPRDIQYWDAAAALIAQDRCVSGNASLIAGSLTGTPSVYTVSAFGAMVSALAPERCTDRQQEDLYARLHSYLDDATDRTAGYVLWNGLPGWGPREPFMLNSDVDTVAASADVTTTVASVLGAYYAGSVDSNPTLHMGYQAAIALSIGQAASPTPTSSKLYLEATGTPIVMSPSYPATAVAATGPVIVRLGSTIKDFQIHDPTINRVRLVSQRLAAVEFNPASAVRAV